MKGQAITWRTVNVVVKNIRELNDASFHYQIASTFVMERDLVRLTVPEALGDGYRWTTSAHTHQEAFV